MSLQGGLPTPGAVPPAPSAGSAPRPAGAPPAAGPPGGAGQRTQPTELDEFLARAVDRQIAEQRALRESLQELSAAVKELQSRPPPPAPSLDLADLDARIRRGMDANAQAFTAQLREFSSSILPEIARAAESAKGSRAIEHDMSILRDAIGGLSADVEGIAQALIDLNAGLRDWAEGVDRNIGGVRTTVDHLRDVATRTEQLQSEAVHQQAEAAQQQAAAIAAAEERLASLQANALAASEERFATQQPAEVAVGELIHVPEVAVPAVPEPPLELTLQRDVGSEIEQRVKETVELSLYLADQIESFDKAISNLGDLPTRLEGVIAQALKRTLAARAKLDREAEMALDEVVATLDEHVGHIGDMSLTAEGIREVANGQTEIAFGLRALAEAIDRSSEGRAPRASSAIAKTTRRLVSDEDLPPARGVRGGSARSKERVKAKPAKSGAKTTKTKPNPKSKAKAKAKASTSSAARRGSRKAVPRKTPADYIDIDLDAD